jgi:hypothetical protein
VLPFQYDLSAMTKRTVMLFLPWSVLFVVLSTLAALNYAVVGASTNSSKSAELIVASTGPTSHPLVADAQRNSALESCLTAWGYVSVERPEIYAAGLENFLGTGCGRP